MQVEIEFMDIDLYQRMKESFQTSAQLADYHESGLNIIAEFENVVDFKLEQLHEIETKRAENAPEVYALCAFGENKVKVFPNSIVLKNTSFQEFNTTIFKVGNRIHFKVEERGEEFSIYFGNLEMVGTFKCLKNFRYEPFYLDVFRIPFTILEKLYQKHGNMGSFKSFQRSSRFSSFEYKTDITNSSFQEDQHYLNFEHRFSRLLNEKRKNILEALQFGEADQIVDSCIKIIGLGNGLTPSGDDYLCGLFGVLIADKNVHERFFPIYEQVIQKSSKLTNEISYSYLCELTELKYRPDFMELLRLFSIECLSSKGEFSLEKMPDLNESHSEKNELITQLEDYFLRLIEIGHFSGTDLVTGMMDGIIFLKRQGIKEFKMAKTKW